MYYFLEVHIPADLEAKLASISYSGFACSGIEEFAIEEARVDEILGERSYSGGDVPTSVIDEVEHTLSDGTIATKFYFNTKDDVEKFQKYLKDEYNLNSLLKAEEIKDWNEEWKKSYKPIFISDELEVVPEWDKNTYQSKAKNQLYIYPGMGFGTGSHETTFLCLKLFFEMTKKPKEVISCLDFGCGSGILGLAVSLFNSKSKIDLYDISDEALDNSKQNIELNDLSHVDFRLLLPEERQELQPKYDVVFANILQNVLLAESKYLASVVNPGGALILSGLLKGQEQEVITSLQKNNPSLVLKSVLNKGDWVAVLMEQNS